MAMGIEEILLECEDKMDKALEHLRGEAKGIRTGRASPALVEYVKIDYYGSMSDLRQLAQVTVPEPTQLLIKPHDPSIVQAIVQSIEKSGLGLRPMTDGKAIRIVLPPLSTQRRKELVNSLHKMAEQSKIAVRNTRRDANKHIDQAEKDKSSGVTEDAAKAAKEDIQQLTKKHETLIDDLIKAKEKEIMEE